jgi:uncharacterized heparinase superfamily protein
MLTAAARYWHTLRWLKPVQLYGRVAFRVKPVRPSNAPPPVARPFPASPWVSCGRPAVLTAPNRLRLLGTERTLALPGDWNNPAWPKLWLYNAHYFDDLVADGASERASWHLALIDRWITENAFGVGNGWEPYPLSLRTVNWIKWLWSGRRGGDMKMTASLAAQARALSQRMEFHLLGNHLWANAKALVFAGVFFEGVEAEGWRARGLQLVHRELEEQVLGDGAHFERSPMYHAIVLEDLLDLIQLAHRWPPLVSAQTLQHWTDVAARMTAWLRGLTHPDGDIAFFNDAAVGIAPSYERLRAYASSSNVVVPEAAAESTKHFADSDFVRIARGDAVLIADVGSVGPSYLPGHAHAGTLSFELSVGGRRVLVNSGTSTYQADAERLRQRGTRAHNTVVVNEADSSEVWGSFRVARRARTFGVELRTAGPAIELRASHDGYRRLRSPVVHHRAWMLRADGLSVIDRLEGGFSSAEARYHFAPRQRPDYRISGGDAKIECSTWHPAFGVSIPNEVLVVRFTEPECRVDFSWTSVAI